MTIQRRNAIRARMQAAGVATLAKVGMDLMGRAIRDAPIEEGTLRGSASFDIIERPDGADVVVRFSTPYAARQHEELTWEHPRGGKARYLADNLLAMIPTYRQALQQAIERAR